MSGNENPPPPATPPITPVMSELQLKIKPERRAAKIANSKIAESTKILASTKIIATTPAPPPKKVRGKRTPKVKIIRKGKTVRLNAKPIAVNKTTVTSVKTHQNNLVVVTKKAATSILNLPNKLVSSTASATKAVIPRLQGKQVTLLKPLLGGKAGTALNKGPVFLLSQGSGSLKSFIPITGAISANSLLSLTEANKARAFSNAPKLVSLAPKIKFDEKKKNETPEKKKNEVPEKKKNDAPEKKKNDAPVKTKRSEHKLIMECEEEELSAAQRIACKKAESEYVEYLRKLAEWEKDPGVELITLGPDDPVPPHPEFPSVQEASRLPLPDNENNCINNENQSETHSEMMPKISEVQSGAKKLADSDSSLAKILHAPALTESGANIMKTMPFVADDQADNNTMMESELEIQLISQKLFSQGYSANNRKELDELFKDLTSKGSLTLEKWMLEKGLFGSSRYCLLHTHVQMKLMYCLNDDEHKSGYKWWCPSCAVMVNVNQGGFFERYKMSCEDILRVLYLWVCNDDISKVISECGNNAKAVHSIYKSLRDMCCNAEVMQQERIGGPTRSVEMADIHIGDCKDTENVMIYCAYERVSRKVILGASTVLNIKASLAKMFKNCIAKETTIVGDRIFQPKVCPTYKFAFIKNSSSSNAANLNALAYLRDQVDPILNVYYKKLTLVNLQSILDELAWRDKFASNPKGAFFDIIEHIKQAYACSVVSPRVDNSLPITLGGKLKVVNSSSSSSDKAESTFAVPADITIEEAKESLMEDEGADGDDEDYIIPVAADCILEEASEYEETLIIDTVNDTIRTRFIEYKKALPVAQKPKQVNAKPAAKVNKRPSQPSAVENKPKEPIAIPLETYYYARMEGIHGNKASEQNRKYKFKCAVCKKVLDENLKMLRHVYSHIDLPQHGGGFNAKCRCNYCFQDFPSPTAKDSHIFKVHSMNMVPTVCKICFKDFPTSTFLLKHMSAKHKRSEMPYHCKICNCRSSFYQEIVNHFNKSHGLSDKLQCRYCLQVFVVKPSSVREEAGISSFWKHLEMHQSKVINRCNFCCLTFISAHDLQAHVNKDHVSFKGMPGLVPVKVSQPPPGSRKYSKPSTSGKELASPSAIATSKKMQTEQVLIRNTHLNSNLCCMECKVSLYRTNHFIQNMVCSMCKFVTSCSRSYANHAIDFHSVPPRKKLKKFHSLDHQLHCLCNFSTNYGDQMARHLIANKCSYKWCYVESNLELNHANSDLA